LHHARKFRFAWLLLVLALVAGACGSDREDDDAGGDTGAGTTEAPSGGSGEAAAFGDLESPCGEGEGGPAAEPGVTEDAITIGYGDDAGYTGSPGLNRQITDAVEALIDWCNEQGGINGRTIEGNYYDAKILDVNNAMQRACDDEVFMLVGQGWALDAQQESIRLECELPSFPTYSVSAAFAHGPDMLQGVPNPVDFTPAHIAAAMADRFPDEVKKAATLGANFAAHLETRAKYKAAWPEKGWEFIDGCDVEYNIAGEADWKPFAQRLKDCGAEVVAWIGSPYPHFQNFLEAADQIGFEPIYVADANNYDAQFAEWNTNGLGDDVYFRFAFLPFEEREESPAVDAYMSLVEEAGGEISLLGMQATSSFLLWATAVDACGADVTRDCVLEEARKIEDWTAGGLHAPTAPGTNMPPDCGMVMKLEGTAYVRVEPEEATEFDCDPSYIGEVTGEIVEAAKLDGDRRSTVFTG
jgi:ABC-type branched-subunit amino acid transport system substrate-binding protein